MGRICSTHNFYYDISGGGNGNPYSGQFQGERIGVGCNTYYSRLASFSSFSFTEATMYYSGGFNGIYFLYNQGIGNSGWWFERIMQNSCSGHPNNNNILPGAVGSNNGFTDTYQNSYCT
jgi:hypothetical protein